MGPADVITIMVGNLIGLGLVDAARALWRRHKAAVIADDAVADETELPSQGPYRTGEPGAVPKERAADEPWLYGPCLICPRCGNGRANNLGRYHGEHSYKVAGGVSHECVDGKNHRVLGKAHVHFQCEVCLSDWGELAPENYDPDDIHK